MEKEEERSKGTNYFLPTSHVTHWPFPLMISSSYQPEWLYFSLCPSFLQQLLLRVHIKGLTCSSWLYEWHFGLVQLCTHFCDWQQHTSSLSCHWTSNEESDWYETRNPPTRQSKCMPARITRAGQVSAAHGKVTLSSRAWGVLKCTSSTVLTRVLLYPELQNTL